MAPVHIQEKDARNKDGKEIEPRTEENSKKIQFIKSLNSLKDFSTTHNMHRHLQYIYKLHSGVVFSTVAKKQKVPGSIPGWKLPMWSSSCVCVGSLQVQWFLKTCILD